MEALFSQLDRAKGRATGTLTKTELGDALNAFFRIGQPGGKTTERHDELLQVKPASSKEVAIVAMLLSAIVNI